MDRIMEWVFTANIHPYQIAAGLLAVYLLLGFAELCYGKLKGGR